ncbi:hypothetical protein LO762_08190 [Actinocorallia sp. API 0066]|uniref:hypothetical protein n=1 Tax=Actinocorallia sp. API 0066 TaxID=2896846 RepID=UPI001E288AC5|nr:hypothetical protein [Actinocorallia sp. API 0066]MCD0449165.1 hypothetical protein [Actinocorallia sp. API 0066]
MSFDPHLHAVQQHSDQAFRRSGQMIDDLHRDRRRRRSGRSTGNGLGFLLLIALGAYIYTQHPDLWHTLKSHLTDFLALLQN